MNRYKDVIARSLENIGEEIVSLKDIGVLVDVDFSRRQRTRLEINEAMFNAIFEEDYTVEYPTYSDNYELHVHAFEDFDIYTTTDRPKEPENENA